jgi:hypothetical protein
MPGYPEPASIQYLMLSSLQRTTRVYDKVNGVNVHFVSQYNVLQNGTSLGIMTTFQGRN